MRRSVHRRTRNKRRTRRTRGKKVGGRYEQYLSNTPFSIGYSVGGTANPYGTQPAVNATMTCQDNYNHYTRTSFRS